ncbi:MAG: DNA polymerase IV [Patescibacteria group bacterium]
MNRTKPERAILHLDMDSYFASVEQQKRPDLRNKPIGISGKPGTRTVVAAASREAKPFGVKSGMTTWEAKKLCPQIQFVRGNLSSYQKITRTWVQILRHYSPTLEIFSIDEAFLDITNTQERFGGPPAMARKIKKELSTKLGKYITASIGIAKNKMLSKIICQWVKPNGIFILENENVKKTLAKISPEEVCSIGPKTAKKLEKMEITSLKELGTYPVENLRAEFGIRGEILKLWGQGIDTSPVVPYWKKEAEKSISHSFTLPPKIDTFQKAKPVLFRLCERTARDMRKKNIHGKTVSLSLRNNDMKSITRQKTLPQPTDQENTIFETCVKLHQRNKLFAKIRLVGVCVSNLTKEKNTTLSLFKDQQKELLAVMDNVNKKYGETLVHAASLPADDILTPPVGFGRKTDKLI